MARSTYIAILHLDAQQLAQQVGGVHEPVEALPRQRADVGLSTQGLE